MDNDVIADFGVGHAGEVDLLLDAAEIHLAGSRKGVAAFEAGDPTWYGKAHSASVYCTPMRVATICPKAMPPSLGGTR